MVAGGEALDAAYTLTTRGNVFVLLHAFVKPGSRIARGEIDLAQRRWADLVARLNEDPRTGHRPIGSDAHCYRRGRQPDRD